MNKKKYTFRAIESDEKIRAQVVLTSLLKRLIETQRRTTGETLSEYLRKAAILRILAEDEEHRELDTLANLLIGSVSLKKHPEWKTKAKVTSWVRKLRNEWK